MCILKVLDPPPQMLLHPQADFPFVNEEGFSLPPGMHTLVAMQREELVLMEQPYSNCTDTGGYVQSQCLASCYARNIGELCGCVDLYMHEYNGTVSEQQILVFLFSHHSAVSVF